MGAIWSANGDDEPVSIEEGRRSVPLLLPDRPGGRANGSIVMAAMIGLAEALGFDKQQQQVAEASAATGEPLDLDFGDLPPLD